MSAVMHEIDPGIIEHVAAIRDRFGLEGLREAEELIAAEIAMTADSYQELAAATASD